MRWIDIVLIALLAVVVIRAVIVAVRMKKSGGCGCGCEGCTGSCQKKTDRKTD